MTARNPQEPRVPLTRDELVQILGEADELTLAQVASVGATAEELRSALAVLERDRPPAEAGDLSPPALALVELLATVPPADADADADAGDTSDVLSD